VHPISVPPGLTGGQTADITQASSLIEGLRAQVVVGDKGYDADALVALINLAGAQAVILPRSNRHQQRAYDRHIYKDRNLVERFFNRLKQFRRIALANNCSSLLNLVCAYIWLA